MPRSNRRSCPGSPTCPVLLGPGERYCPVHLADYESRRGTPASRGYGRAHRARRADAAPTVAAGAAKCWRCGEPIAPTDTWHLGHDDHDRAVTRGPEHELCNLRAAGRASHAALPPF